MKAESKLTVVVLSLSVFLLAASSSCAKGKVEYKLKLKKDQKFDYRTVTEQKTAQIVMGNVQETEQTTGFGFDLDVQDVDRKGNATLKWTYTWILYKQKGTAGQVTYDSSKKGAVPPQAKTVAALLGESFTTKLTPKGQVTELKGFEQMNKNIKEKLPPGPVREHMAKGIMLQFGAEAMKETIEASWAIYPNRAVVVGDSWEKKMVLAKGFPTIQDNKFTLKERKAGAATIEVSSVLKPNPDAKPMEMGSARIKYEMAGKQNGQIKLDESTGRIIKSKITQRIAGDMTMGTGGGKAQGGFGELNIGVDVDSVITVEMNKRKPKKQEKQKEQKVEKKK